MIQYKIKYNYSINQQNRDASADNMWSHIWNKEKQGNTLNRTW